MIIDLIGLCFLAIIFSVGFIICELMYEVHKEIRKGNVELPIVKLKNESNIKFTARDYGDYYTITDSEGNTTKHDYVFQAIQKGLFRKWGIDVNDKEDVDYSYVKNVKYSNDSIPQEDLKAEIKIQKTDDHLIPKGLFEELGIGIKEEENNE